MGDEDGGNAGGQIRVTELGRACQEGVCGNDGGAESGETGSEEDGG